MDRAYGVRNIFDINKSTSIEVLLSSLRELRLFTSAAVIGLALQLAEGRGIKFVDGERHMFEHFAGVVGGGRNAFLFGNGVFRAVNEVLRGALNANDGEEAERDGEDLSVIFVGDPAVHAVADGFGEILRVEMATGSLAYVENAGVQHERVHDLENGGGKIVAGRFRMVTAAEVRIGAVALEDVDVAFAAVKDHLFLNDGDTVGLLRSAETSADLNGDLDIHGNADLIEAPIEGHVVDVNVCAEDLRAFGADRGSTFQ